ncbi:hypothetical protein U4Z93_25665, partial [Escherichia coli]|nr:hypothetical protein [Escherichia coli]
MIKYQRVEYIIFIYCYAIWGDMKMIIWYQPTIFLTPGSIF